MPEPVMWVVRPIARLLAVFMDGWDVTACAHVLTRPKQLRDGRLAEVCWECGGHSPGTEPLSPDPRPLASR